MRNIKFIIISFVAILFVTNCQDDDIPFGDITAPSNLQITAEIVGADADNPNGDGSGVVNFKATADNALSFQYVFNDSRTSAPNGEKTYSFATLGLNTYTVTVIAYGTGGAATSESINVDVLSLYEPPAELITMLTGNSSRTWRMHIDAPNYFGLGPVGTETIGEFFPNGGIPDKSGSGMYDDRYIFNIDGTFTHITNSENDEDGVNTDGTVFGRNGLIEEIGGPGDGTPEGDDILNYSYSDYTEQWFLTAPGGTETLSLTGLGFIGYYVGGGIPHSYRFYERTENTMTLIITDGNGQFDWNFILIAE